MDEIEFSPEAIDVLSKFYGVDEIVLVEGDEDAPFWRFLFKLFHNRPVKVRGVGGKPSLAKYIENLSGTPRNYYVAVDSDYELLFGSHENNRVLCTYGHSIENSMICDQTVCQVVQTYALVDNDAIAPTDCLRWITDETGKLEKLIALELENFRSNYKTEILGKNCARHCSNSSSPKLDERKLEACITELNFDAKHKTAKQVKDEIQKGMLAKDMIRGHYLFSMTLRYVKANAKKYRKSVSISNDSLFSALLMAFQLTFTVGHAHYKHYEGEFSRLTA